MGLNVTFNQLIRPGERPVASHFLQDKTWFYHKTCFLSLPAKSWFFASHQDKKKKAPQLNGAFPNKLTIPSSHTVILHFVDQYHVYFEYVSLLLVVYFQVYSKQGVPFLDV